MLESNPFKYEVAMIAQRGEIGKCNFFNAVIKSPKETVRPINIMQLDRYRDYIDNFTQLLTITLVTTLAEYNRLVLYDHSDLKLTLTMYDIGKDTPYSLKALSRPREFTYKAKMIDVASDQISQNNPISNSDGVGQMTMKTFSIQLLEPCFESVSIKSVGGPFRRTSGIELMKTLLTRFSTDDDIDAVTAVTGVDVVEGYSTLQREQIIIKHATPLVKAITKVQESCGGVYPTGFSFFLQNNKWFIFPPYDLTLFSKAKKTITVVNLPKDRLPGLEKTYFNSSTKLVVLSTRDATYIDNREANIFNQGSSISFVEADRYFNGFAEVKDNKIMVNASKNVNEVTLQERADGVNVLRGTETRITANKNIELSKLAKAKGFYIQLTWEYSDDSLLYPGMPAKVLFLKDQRPASAVGVLIESETIWVPAEKSFKNTKFNKMTAMTFFVGNEEYMNS